MCGSFPDCSYHGYGARSKECARGNMKKKLFMEEKTKLVVQALQVDHCELLFGETETLSSCSKYLRQQLQDQI